MSHIQAQKETKTTKAGTLPPAKGSLTYCVQIFKVITFVYTIYFKNQLNNAIHYNLQK